MLSDFCVCTIRHSDDLKAAVEVGGTGEYKEHKRWVEAVWLVDNAMRHGKRLPIFFAPAEATDPLFGWAALEKVTVDSESTTTRSRGRRDLQVGGRTNLP